MSDFIPFKEFHKDTNLSYQQLLRTFHKVRKGKDFPLLEGEDYHYEGKDDVSGRTGILFVNPVLLFPKLKKQRIDLAHVVSPVIPDETIAVSHETNVKPSENRQTKENHEEAVSGGFNVVQDKTEVKPSETTQIELVRSLTNQLEAKDKQIERKDGQIDDLTDTINKLEVNRYGLQEALEKAHSVVYSLTQGEGKDSKGGAGEAEEVKEQEGVPEQKPEPEVGEVVGASYPPTPHQPSQNGQDEDFTPEEGIPPSSISEPHTEENFGVGEGTPPPQDYGEDGEVINTTFG